MEGFNINKGGSSSSPFVHQLLSPDNRHPDPDSDSDSDNRAHPVSSGGGRLPHSPNLRLRGRPPGSKNKPKPKTPVVVTRDTPNAFRSHVLEVSAGADIVESLNNYARRKGRGVCVLTGTGMVSNVTIRQPNSSVLTLRGSFDILMLTGTVLPPPAPPGSTGLSIFLTGGQGQVVGGSIVGPLIVTERVVLMTASFANAVFERLPVENINQAAAEENAGGDQAQQQVQAAAASQSSGVTSGGVSLTFPMFNVAPPPRTTYAFSADLSGWAAGGSVAPRPPF